MPQQSASTTNSVTMKGVDVGGDGTLASLAVIPAGSQLVDSSLHDIRAIVRQSGDAPGIVVVFGNHWFTKLFAEVWSSLPRRLAALAMRPPAYCTFELPPGFERSSLIHEPPQSIGESLRHWTLARLAISNAPLIVRNVPIQWDSVEAQARAAGLDERGLPELLASSPPRDFEWLFGELRLARLTDLCGKIVSPADATAVVAGLWLLHGDADMSHRHSQSIEDEGRHRCGNFWHGIMHRQEPDYGNSKYWFRRVGQHPIFPELARRADALMVADGSEAALRWRTKLGAPSRWDPLAFVDWCESAVCESDAAQIRLLRRIQFVEMHLLLRASFEDATGAPIPGLR